MLSSAHSCSSESTQMSDPPEIIQCRFFKRDRKCRDGDKCKFSHDISSTVKNDDNESAIVNPDPCPESAENTNTGTGQESKNSETDNASKLPAKSRKPPKKQTICKFYASGYCRGGSHCTFLHERPPRRSSAKKDSSKPTDEKANNQNVSQQEDEQPKKNAKTESRKQVKVCYFFKTGSCKKGNNCPFRHPDYLKKDGDGSTAKPDDSAAKPVQSTAKPVDSTAKPVDSKAKPVDDKANSFEGEPDDSEANDNDPVDRVPFERPNIIPNQTSMKMLEVTDVGIKKLRSTEITQFKTRFPDALREESERLETYRITINPTDPDWPFDMRDFELWISFPELYPLEPFLVDMPEDQDLPETVIDSMVPKLQEWVAAKHATNEVAGKVELIFRPFLRWLDKKLETLFTEAARKFKKKVDAKAAGFEFVPNKQSDEPQEEKQFDVPNEPCQDEETTDDTLGDTPDNQDDEPSSTTATLSSSSKFESADTNRRGTEVLLRGLQLSEGVGTFVCQRLSISIQCSRCKTRCEITTPARRANVVKCTKCQHHQQITFRPSLAHKFSSTMGFLDLEGCTPFDLVLMDCEFAVGCINCPKELILNELHYGQTKTSWCLKCHQKMELTVESTKFQKLTASQQIDSSKAHVINLKSDKKPTKDPAIQEGKPLPDNGTCKHYKKSFRWLRFPCCGKTYPCDQCHDDSEPDHEMKYAIRMICGFCCKEQAFTSDKPCISCGSMTTKGKTEHWEGGKGCRDKVKMSRNDKQKYSDTNKTVSRKAQKDESSKKGQPKK